MILHSMKQLYLFEVRQRKSRLTLISAKLSVIIRESKWWNFLFFFCSITKGDHRTNWFINSWDIFMEITFTRSTNSSSSYNSNKISIINITTWVRTKRKKKNLSKFSLRILVDMYWNWRMHVHLLLILISYRIQMIFY